MNVERYSSQAEQSNIADSATVNTEQSRELLQSALIPEQIDFANNPDFNPYLTDADSLTLTLDEFDTPNDVIDTSRGVSRRRFLQTAAAVGTVIGLASTDLKAVADEPVKKRREALITSLELDDKVYLKYLFGKKEFQEYARNNMPEVQAIIAKAKAKRADNIDFLRRNTDADLYVTSIAATLESAYRIRAKRTELVSDMEEVDPKEIVITDDHAKRLGLDSGDKLASEHTIGWDNPRLKNSASNYFIYKQGNKEFRIVYGYNFDNFRDDSKTLIEVVYRAASVGTDDDKAKNYLDEIAF